MERALQKSRAQQLKAKPIENMRKCVELLTDVDTRLFATMGPEDRENVQSELQELANIVANFQKKLSE